MTARRVPLGPSQRVVSARPKEMYQDNRSVHCLWKGGDNLTRDKKCGRYTAWTLTVHIILGTGRIEAIERWEWYHGSASTVRCGRTFIITFIR